jgi:hypothetical protein
MKFAVLVIVLLVLLNFGACKKRDSPSLPKTPDCGCDSPVIDTLIGINANLYYDTNSLVKPIQYQLIAGTPGAQRIFFVCDSNFQQLQSIVDTNRNAIYRVVFSGYERIFCNIDTIGWAGASPWNIELTNLTIY